MSQSPSSAPARSLPVLPRRSFGQTSRKDNWWVVPLLTFLGLGTFIVYSTWAAFQGDHYRFGPVSLAVLFAGTFGDSPHSWFGAKPGLWPAWLPFSPALLILWAPGGFRFTCYYYRGAYYKAFWADPPSCAVGEPRKSYWGENSLPLILQNVHRYFMYLALIFLVLLALDVLAGAVVGRRRHRQRPFRHRTGHAGPGGQCLSAERLHLRLPFAAASDRRRHATSFPSRTLATRPTTA